jgi:nitroreductase
MEFTEVVRKRRMVRNFTDEPVADDVLERIIATAQRAPSAGFSQGVVFVTVTEPARKQEVAAIAGEAGYTEGGFDPFISGAAVQVIVCTSEQRYHDRYNERDKLNDDGTEIHWPIPYWHTDAGCSVMLLLLAAVNEGLGSTFIGVPNDPTQLNPLLGIPAEYLPVGIVLLGHPAPDKRSGSLKRGHRPLDAIWHREHWQGDPTERTTP